MYYFRAIGCRWNIVYGCLGQKFVWKFKGKIVVFLNVAMCLGCKLFSRSINSLFNFSAKWQAWLTEQNCRTKLSSTFACFGDDTFSPFSGIYIQSSCWESCSVDSQWNSDVFFYFFDWTFQSWVKKDYSATTEWWRWCWSSSHFSLQNKDPSDRKLFSLIDWWSLQILIKQMMFILKW